MACWAPEIPVWAMAAAPATASSRFLGLAPARSAANPSAVSGLNLSTAPIHCGIGAWSSPRGRLRNCRSATRSSRAPRTSFIQLTQVAGSPDWLAPAGPATASTIVPTMPRPSSQPARNARPLALARGVVSISTTAMMGIGLIAIPIASGSDPPMAWPISPLPFTDTPRLLRSEARHGSTSSIFAGHALFLGELHPPADHFGGMQPDDGPGRLAVRPGRLRQSLGHAADHYAPGPPRRQHVIDHERDIRVVLRVAELPAPGEVPAANVDHVQPGVVAPAEGNDVRQPGSVDGREPAKLALSQVGQLGIREHAQFALTHLPRRANGPDATRAGLGPSSPRLGRGVRFCRQGRRAGRLHVSRKVNRGPEGRPTGAAWPSRPTPTAASVAVSRASKASSPNPALANQARMRGVR